MKVRMRKQMSATETRVHFGEVLQTVGSDGDYVIVERDGKPVVAIVPINEFDEFWSAKVDDWMESARQARAMIARAYAGRPIPDADELIDGGRDDID
jgi:prevent-host-death family protein